MVTGNIKTEPLGSALYGGFSSFARSLVKVIPRPRFFFFFQVEVSSRMSLSLFRLGSAHSDSASWDDCSWIFPDELRVSSFPWWVPVLCLHSIARTMPVHHSQPTPTVLGQGCMRLLCVTCHLHFWQNDRSLLHCTAVTQGLNGHRIRISTQS